MKPKEILYLLGYKPKSQKFGYTISHFDFPVDGPVDYAQWLHPGETKKVLTQSSVDELRRFLKTGDVAIDIGAHTGDTSIPMALAVKKSGCVLALEPNPFVFDVLKKNCELNPEKTNIIPLKFAATPGDGNFVFEYSDSGFCNGGLHEGISKWIHGHAFQLQVVGKNLRNFLQKEHPSLIPRIRYIKVDAEGYDFTILQSLRSLLSECRPFVKAEVFKRTRSELRIKMYQLLRNLEYELYRVENESNYRGDRLSEQDLTKWRHYDIFCVPAELSPKIEVARE
jgi:FkbM family methyltransferase